MGGGNRLHVIWFGSTAPNEIYHSSSQTLAQQETPLPPRDQHSCPVNCRGNLFKPFGDRVCYDVPFNAANTCGGPRSDSATTNADSLLSIFIGVVPALALVLFVIVMKVMGWRHEMRTSPKDWKKDAMHTTEGVKGLMVRYGIWLVICGAAVLYILSLTSTIAGHDESAYVMLARSLSTGQGFRDLHLPGSPPSTLRPFGYPLILAPMAYLFPGFPANIIPLKLVSVSLSCLSLLLVYCFYVSLDLDRWLSLALVAVMATAPLTVLFATRTLSEAAYLALSLAALLLLQRWERTGFQNKWLWLLAVAVMAYAYFTRTVGLSLVVAAVSYLLFKKKWNQATLTVALFALLISPWLYRNLTVGTSGIATDYLQDQFWLKDMQKPYLGTIGLVDLLGRLFYNARGHATETILWLFFPWAINGWWSAFLERTQLQLLSWVSPALGIAVTGAFIMGHLVSLVRRLRVEHLYVVIYIITILLPPWYAERNLWPLLPFLLYFFVTTILWISERVNLACRWPVSLATPVLVVGLCAILLGFAMSDRHLVIAGADFRRGDNGQLKGAFGEICDWIRVTTAPDDLIVYGYPVKIYLYTGRNAMDIPMIIRRDAFLSALARAGVDYVVLELDRAKGYKYDLLDQIYLQPAVAAYPESFVPIHKAEIDMEHSAFVIYRFASTTAPSEAQ